MDNEEILHIRYPNGEMYINKKEFFPCSASKLKKLIRLTEDPDWYEHAKEITAFLEDRIAEETDWSRASAAGAVEARTKAVEMQPDIDRQQGIVDRMAKAKAEVRPGHKKEYMVRLKGEKERLSALKAKQRDCMDVFRFYNAGFKKSQSLIRTAEEDIEVLRVYAE